MKKLLSALLLTLPMLSQAAPGDVVSLGEDVGATFRLNSSSLTIEPDLAPIRDNDVDIGSATNRFRRIYAVEVIEASGTLTTGSSNYVQIRQTLQSNSTFHVQLGSATRFQADSYGGPSGSIGSNMLQAGNTSYVGIQSTLQPDSTFYVGLASATSLSVGVSTHNGIAYFNGGSSSRPGITFSTATDTGFTVPSAGSLGIVTNGALRVSVSNGGVFLSQGDGTAASPQYSFNNDSDMGTFRKASNVLGIAAGGIEIANFNGDTSTLNIASNTVGPSCASGFYRTGTSVCLVNNGAAILIVSSNPATNGSVTFTTYDIPSINSTNAKAVLLHSFCFNEQDAVTDTASVKGEAQKPGGGVASGDISIRQVTCNKNLALDNASDTNERWVQVDAAKDIALLCARTGAGISPECDFSIAGYVE